MKIVKHMKKRAMGLMLGLCLLAGLVSGFVPPKGKSPWAEADTWVFSSTCAALTWEAQMGAAGKNLDEILAADIPGQCERRDPDRRREKNGASHDLPRMT